MIKRWLLLAMVGCALALPVAHAQEGGIARIDPLPATGQTAAGIFHERDFKADPAVPSAIGNGAWRLQPAVGLEQPLLLVYHPYSARVSVRLAPDAMPIVQTLFDRDLDPQYSRHALVFPLSGE
jgi:hypothetical protein